MHICVSGNITARFSDTPESIWHVCVNLCAQTTLTASWGQMWPRFHFLRTVHSGVNQVTFSNIILWKVHYLLSWMKSRPRYILFYTSFKSPEVTALLKPDVAFRKVPELVHSSSHFHKYEENYAMKAS